jgi:uncharacterized protein (DUF58 family)
VPALSLLWSLPAALLAAGLAYESVVIGRARIELCIVPPDRWFLGRATALRFDIRHALGRPLDLEMAPAAPADFVSDRAIRTLRVPVADTASLELACVPRALGAHRWPPLRIRAGGVLGLAWWPRDLRADCEVRVGPDLLRAGSAAAGLAAAGSRGGRAPGSGSELLQLRQYQPGDSPRLIDWKATARAQRLVCREFTEDQHLEIMIVIDAGRASGIVNGDLDRFGHYVNAAARLAEYAVSLDDQVGLMLYSDRPILELRAARGTAAVIRLRRALAAARVEGAESNPLQAAARVRALSRHRSLVVMLTDLDDATVAGQLASAVRLLRPTHLPFVAGLSSAAAETLSRAPAERWSDPYRALAAQEYCRSLDRKVAALRALGAPTLVSRPAQLDRAVFDAYATFRRVRRV